MSPVYEYVVVECYAGHQGEETPRAVVLDGRRFEVTGVLSRKRVLDLPSGLRRDVWRCRLDDGRTATIERFEAGAWRVSA